ncbi:ferrochelatase [Gloeomargarita lithophora Alchichica-D10]|uniref:Ferrochelatase n=1 Tax=Gloeomargarita lithophora Alchichica-D10 TaxID=1188229 RepID=A0A1J0AB68_9CYAN|nr:ferrochelatase [Gloeomargarita lithophora]APB33180.1 ferrochelatase [Gloeomargarita lithophora Alchichica-D10]
MSHRLGVLLLNLGGPERLEDVRPFLYNLFADPEIIRLPLPWLQKPLAWFIATMRHRRSRENYRQIGGGSPIRHITEEQANALAQQLYQTGHPAQVYIGMRYWHPFTEEAIAQIERDGVEKLVILPLYPQYSISTSGSSLRLLERLRQTGTYLAQIEHTVIPYWYQRPGYIGAMVDLIRQTLYGLPAPDRVHLLFSAHGVPRSYVDKDGDPYQEQIEICVELIVKALDCPNAHTLTYQSRVGPVEWLQPYTEDVIPELGAQGVRDLLVIPISFVSEHIETLQEIDMEYRELAHQSGIIHFHRVPALNTHPRFIQDLAAAVVEANTASSVPLNQVINLQKPVKIYPQERWQWGLTPAAEVWNGRLAMVGFMALLMEMVTGWGPLHLVGLM